MSLDISMRLNAIIDAEIEKAAYSEVLGSKSIEEKLKSISKLPELNRSRLAEFCYQRVHLRELGLRIAASCRLQTLQFVFGANAALVLEQAADVQKNR
jgi:hypothetical protein